MRRAGSVDRAGSFSRDDFDLAFTWSFLSRLTGLENIAGLRHMIKILNAVSNV